VIIPVRKVIEVEEFACVVCVETTTKKVLEGRLISPAAELGGDGCRNVLGVLAAHVASRSVVTDGVLVHRRGRAADDHVAAAVNGDASDTGSGLPDQLRQVTHTVKNVLGNVLLAEIWHHRRQLALVPAVGDARGNVEGVARDSEEVLALTSSLGDEVRKSAFLGRNESVVLAGFTPGQWLGAVVCASSVVVVQHGSFILGSR
jgi:hypothetical protein